MSGDAEQDGFTDGMTEDLITDLSKVSGLFVIARNSTFTYKGKPVKVRQVAEELGVRYVLEGSMRRSNGQIRINAQLIDAVSGGHIWAERYDSSLTDIFALQDKVTRNIVAALAVNLTADEKTQREHKETDSSEAYEALLRGRARYDLGSPEDLAKAVAYLKKAIELDPNYARAHGLLAATYYRAWSGDDVEPLGLTIDEADQKAREHLKEAMKKPTPMAHTLTAKLLTGDLRYDEAIAEAKRAIALDPSDAAGYTALARTANKANRPTDALDALETAVRLDPRGNANGQNLWRMGESYYLLGQYDKSVATMLKYIELSGDAKWGSFILGAAYGQLGREQEAKAAIEKFNESLIKSGKRPYTLAHLDGWALVPAVREHYREGLRKAGMLPGGSYSHVLAGVHTAALEVDGATTLTVTEAKSLSDARLSSVDVRRNDNDWNAGHIPGATFLHMYHDFSEENLTEAVGKDEAVVIYADGLGSSLSARASARAAIWGFKRVSYFRDGFPAWKAAGYSVEVPSK
jgi:TolB-like protein/rhodanese-related sulfurtransferase